mmetsp:Transcript_77410/g.250441  ORF Transcript_77410/g.250441 Transcript_77410/m.250441 type:complete len:212 (+) Transcript_77410:16-651(+)
METYSQPARHGRTCVLRAKRPHSRQRQLRKRRPGPSVPRGRRGRLAAAVGLCVAFRNRPLQRSAGLLRQPGQPQGRGRLAGLLRRGDGHGHGHGHEHVLHATAEQGCLARRLLLACRRLRALLRMAASFRLAGHGRTPLRRGRFGNRRAGRGAAGGLARVREAVATGLSGRRGPRGLPRVRKTLAAAAAQDGLRRCRQGRGVHGLSGCGSP